MVKNTQGHRSTSEHLLSSSVNAPLMETISFQSLRQSGREVNSIGGRRLSSGAPHPPEHEYQAQITPALQSFHFHNRDHFEKQG